ncbi:ion transport protein [Chloropicon primus]|uniref:Ion transport protein n=1 Tax=Chloropicon primus TaxID=1764295 RepID=A0A5B8MZK9_9CHLO|nr:ion transport protein [Chloropicon primus]UPR05324.1 ion transport protein [Chloropicon primus]|eukprot:QDZ26107.1 ion transport protein [Chloropicon primus]
MSGRRISDSDIPNIGDAVRSSWSGSLSELKNKAFPSQSSKGDDATGSFTSSRKQSKWHSIKRSPLDVQQVKTEIEGLRNSEHRLSKIMANLGNPNSKRKGRRIHRKSILDIKKNEKLLQVEWKRRYWDLFLCFYIILYDILSPYRIAFFDSAYRGSAGFWFAFERLTELLFVCDIIQYYWDVFLLLMPFLNPNMEGRHTIKMVNIHETIPYKSLLVDLISLMPLEPIVIASCGSDYKCKSVAKCLPFFRMLRTFTVIITQRRYEKHLLHINIISVELFQLFANILLLVILVHSSACLWWLTYVLEGYPENGWDNFVNKFELDDSPVTDRYAAALYWSTQTMTTIGFGDVTPSTVPELTVSIIVMIVGAVTFAYFVGKMSANVQDANKGSSRFHQVMRELNEFMVQRQLPPSLQTKIRAFFQYRHLSGKWGFDESALLREMSPTMRASVILYNNKDAIRRVPWFADGEPDFLFRICACLHTIYCAPGELLIREGEIGQEMYLLIKGQVEIFNQTGTFHTVIEAKDASEAKYFGEVSALFGDRRLASVKALSFLDVLSISKVDLDAVLDYFPALKHRIRMEGSRRRRRRIFVKVIAVVRLMNLARTDKRVTTDWTVEDLLNLKNNLAKRQTGDIIDPTLNEMQGMSLGHINEIASVGNMSSVAKSRRSSYASVKDLGVTDREFLDEINIKIQDKKEKQLQTRPARSYSDSAGLSGLVERSNNSVTSQSNENEENGQTTHSAGPTVAESSFDRDRLLLGSVQSMLQTFKDDLLGQLDERYQRVGESLDRRITKGPGQAKDKASRKKKPKVALDRVIGDTPPK